jgi:hypothetical protein
MKSKPFNKLPKTASGGRFTRLAPLALALLLPLVLASCTTVPRDGATLVLSVEDPYGAKTLVPDIDMVPAGYDFSGNGPNGDSFALNDSRVPASVTALAPGEWTVCVNAKNAAGTVIAQGQQVTTIGPGATKSVVVEVTPVKGYGTLDLTLHWTAAEVANPSISAQLIPVSGAPIALAFTVPQAGTGTCSRSGLPAGYYSLVARLMDGGAVVMGAVEVVRIVSDATTHGTFDFYDVNQPDGNITVRITPQMNDPIDVAMAGQVAEIDQGGSMTVSGSVPANTGNVVYVWYVNGVSKATGASYTLGSDLPPGVYRLDLICFTADGTRAGSVTSAFKVVEVTYTQITLEWDPNTEPDLQGYKVYWGFSSGVYLFSKDVGNQTTCTVTGLIVGKTYYFAVTAYNAVAESGYSNEIEYTAQ